MPAFFPFLETLLKRTFWYRPSINRSKTLFFHRCLRFWEEEIVNWGQVRWIRWLSHHYGFLFRPKTHAQASSWCVIIVQNPWLVFAQFCALLTNCFEQSTHNFKVVFLIDLWPCGKNCWCTTPLQSKKTVSKTFTFDRTSRAVFDPGSSGRFHWSG